MIHSFIHLFIHQSSAFKSFFLNAFTADGSPATLPISIKPMRMKTLKVFLRFTTIHNKRRRSADYSLVPFISFAFSNSGSSLRVRAMTNYPRAASFRCANSATSCAGAPFATFSSKQIMFFEMFCRTSLSGLNGSVQNNFDSLLEAAEQAQGR